MKIENKSFAQEPYEAPAIEEIAPVTLVYGSAGEGDVSPGVEDDDDNTGGLGGL